MIFIVKQAVHTRVVGGKPHETSKTCDLHWFWDSHHCPDAEVKIVNPSEWSPPKLDEISDQEISKLVEKIMGQIMEYLINHKINIDRDDFMKGGTEIRNPVSGKVLFVFKETS